MLQPGQGLIVPRTPASAGPGPRLPQAFCPSARPRGHTGVPVWWESSPHSRTPTRGRPSSVAGVPSQACGQPLSMEQGCAWRVQACGVVSQRGQQQDCPALALHGLRGGLVGSGSLAHSLVVVVARRSPCSSLPTG